MLFSRNVDKLKVKGEDGGNPSVDGGGRCDVRILEHAFDVLRVDFDDEVADTDDVELEGLEGPVKTIEFELGLGESCLTVVEGDGAEPAEVANFGVSFVALRKEVANCDLRGVDCEDD